VGVQAVIREHPSASAKDKSPIMSAAANQESTSKDSGGTLICFSHLRWNFVYQRPQHLMSRFARKMRVYYMEEPVFGGAAEPVLEEHPTPDGVTVLVPRLPDGTDPRATEAAQADLLGRFCRERGVARPVLWYYTPMALAFSDRLEAGRVVYDCMDELSAFAGAPPELLERERALLARADVVFTGGYSLFEAKRDRHPNVHAFPSSVEVAHFRKARERLPDPPDQAPIPRPRVGHYAVIDERLDAGLVAAVADLRPDWQLVLLGPVVKIDAATLPKRRNVHYLGGKAYGELPAYLAGWDVAFMPFALNESTRFISPTKTPEYLAAGKPVVSTPVRDVVRSYGERGLVRIAATPEEAVAAIEESLAGRGDAAGWLAEVDRALEQMSWDQTWAQMRDLI
jgi:hypothetical protein